MTKKELEKEAEDFLQKKWGTSEMLILGGDARKVLADFAEPREKQIEIDAKQIRALQKQNGELTDELSKKSDTNHQLIEQLAKLNERCSELEDKLANADYQLEGRDNEIRELEAQIEKMKCCPTCDNNKEEHTPEEHYRCKTCKKFCNWELAD